MATEPGGNGASSLAAAKAGQKSKQAIAQRRIIGSLGRRAAAEPQERLAPARRLVAAVGAAHRPVGLVARAALDDARTRARRERGRGPLGDVSAHVEDPETGLALRERTSARYGALLPLAGLRIALLV